MFEGLFRGGLNTGGPIRKKGLGRVLEIIMDNLTRFLVSSLICLVTLIPGTAAALYAIGTGNGLLLLAAGAVGGALFGPAYGAMSDGMLYALRGVPGNWWRKYCRAWQRDWKGNLVPGAVTGLLLVLLLYEGAVISADPGFLPTSMYVCSLLSAAVALAVFTYFWPQREFSDLKLGQLLHNSLLMLLARPVNSLKTALVQMLYWGLIVVGFPYSTIALPLLGLWFPQLMGLLVVYRQLNEDFQIEERLGEEGL